MRVLIVGSGLIGLATAYFLRRRGHEVTILDREEGPGLETSFANGALLTPSMSDPWNAPGCWRVLFGSLVRSDAPLQLRPGALPSMAGWGIGFLRNSRPDRYEHNTLANLRLALHSLRVLKALREDTGIEYGRAANGSLKVFRDEAALDAAQARAERLRGAGLTFQRLSAVEAVTAEPALTPIVSRIAGALCFDLDETGDAYRFCVGLADHLRSQGVDFRFKADVTAIEVRSGKVSAVVASGECLVADRYVVAAGSYTAPLLHGIGVSVPVRPAKGYSITFAVPPPLKIPVIDDRLHAAVVPLEGALRVAGTAEFAGYDLTLPAARIRNLVSLVQEVLPEERLDPAAAKPWCGLRPMSMDGVPIIGPTQLPNLLVNTGHGHLGWTMAAGSGDLMAQLISAETGSIDPAPYDLSRFG